MPKFVKLAGNSNVSSRWLNVEAIRSVTRQPAVPDQAAAERLVVHFVTGDKETFAGAQAEALKKFLVANQD
jgi:hypothetical protein